MPTKGGWLLIALMVGVFGYVTQPDDADRPTTCQRLEAKVSANEYLTSFEYDRLAQCPGLQELADR
jgi:hypothetical protein